MSIARRFFGGALIAIGVAGSLLTFRTVTGARAAAEAAVQASAEAAATRSAEAQRAAEAKARKATTITALRSAFDDHVDGDTIVDLFDSEDWWAPYRSEFPLVRVIVGSEIVAARGKMPLGSLDAGVVASARRQGVASALVPVDGQTALVAAARIPGDDPEFHSGPVLVLARPFVPSAPAAVQVPRFADQTVSWVLSAGIGLAGFGLLIGGRGRRPGPVAGEILHETTAKMGSVSSSQQRPPSALMAAGPISETVWTDGSAIRGPGFQTASSLSAVAPTAVAVPTTPIAPSPSAQPAPTTALFAVAMPTAAARTAVPFGRYQLRERLAEGGMSEIFVADAIGAEGFRRTFVLKKLRPELAGDKGAVSQFVDEARLQAGLVHPNIVPVLDFGVINGEYFMAEEYVAGRDLAKLMGRYQGGADIPLPTPLAYYIAHETLQALAFAHETTTREGAPLGIVHRDIAAGNLLVSVTGEVKLIDFGIVMASDRVAKTMVGMVKGNVNFMSPEQARGQVVDSRSDLFSLGLVLYYMLTGQVLYGAGNDLGALYQATNGPTPVDYARIGALPEPAGAILQTALAFDPRERFQTAGEFADAIAAQTTGGKAIAAKLMHHLFGDEIRSELARRQS
jgi:hypothetical protein